MLNLSYAESHAQIAPIYDKLIYNIEQYVESQFGRYSHHLKTSHFFIKHCSFLPVTRTVLNGWTIVSERLYSL